MVSYPPKPSSSDTSGAFLIPTLLANLSEWEEQLPLLKMAYHLQLFKLSGDGPQTPSKSTSAKTLFLSMSYYLAKLHALYPHTSMPWIPNFHQTFLLLLTNFLFTHRLFFLYLQTFHTTVIPHDMVHIS